MITRYYTNVNVSSIFITETAKENVAQSDERSPDKVKIDEKADTDMDVNARPTLSPQGWCISATHNHKDVVY